MEITVIIVAICAAITGTVAAVLVFDNRYRDGMVVRTGLSFLAIASYIRVTSILFEGESHVTPVAALLWVGCALFFSAHYLRFKYFSNLAPKTGERRKQFGAAK